MDLDQIQRTMFDAMRQPLTADEDMRQRTRDGRSMRGVAEAIIKPNDRLTSFERLEIYNRQYWFRVLSALAEDFEGLRLILGDRAFREDVGCVLARLPVAVVHAAQSGLAAGVMAARASRAHRGSRGDRARHGATGMGRNRSLRRSAEAATD